jgi:hypothetical protein
MARRLLDTVLSIVIHCTWQIGQTGGQQGSQEAVGHSTERKVLLFTVPGKEVGQEASKDGQEAVGHSAEYC